MTAELLLHILPLPLSLVLSAMILHRSRISRAEGKPMLGGVAVFPILMISLCLTLGISNWLQYYDLLTAELGITGNRILQVISGCALLYIIGLKSDFHGTWAHTKWLVLLAAVGMFPLSGLWIRDLGGLFGLHALAPWLGIGVTILLALYLTESVALLDDQRGCGLLIPLLMMSGSFALSLYVGFTLGIMIAAATLGLLLPYACLKWFHPEWHDARLGISGAYPLGYILTYSILSLIHPAGIDMPAWSLPVVLATVLLPMGATLCSRAARRADKRNLCLVQMHLDYRQRRQTEQADHRAWDAHYGRQAWEADTPVETIRRKHIEFGTLGVAPEYIQGEETAFIPDGMNAFERNAKRFIDMVGAAVLLVLFSPLFLLCYILIRLDDGGPAIYSQERIGRFGRPFRIYKFRSMRLDAEADGPALSTVNKGDDPRLTRIGRFLRTHHLDELPQLWNVLIGDMAFIGYRPERKYYIDQIMEHDPRYSMLYQIRPGVTSYATLYNGYTDTMAKMLRRLTYDLYYLEHRSFWFDARVLWRTFINIVFGRKF